MALKEALPDERCGGLLCRQPLCDRAMVAASMEALVHAFNGRGLTTHEEQTSYGELEALGVVLDMRRRHTRLTRKHVVHNCH